jgi:hypothetical protein
VRSGLTTKAEPPPTRDVNRDSGTDSANSAWVSCWELHSELQQRFLIVHRRDLAPES